MRESLLRNVKTLGNDRVLQVYDIKVEFTNESEKYDVLADQELSISVESGQVFALIDCGMMGQWYAHYRIEGNIQTRIKWYDDLYSVPENLFN